MATVKIENISDARVIGPKYGVDFPEGKGRPPMLKLLKAIADAGDIVEDTEYFKGDWHEHRRSPGTAGSTVEFELTVKGGKTFREGVTDKGKRYKVPVKTEDATYRLNVATIRKLAGTVGLKGRVSTESLIAAFKAESGLADIDPTAITKDGLPVLKPKAVKAPKAVSEPVTATVEPAVESIVAKVVTPTMTSADVDAAELVAAGE